VLNLSNGKLVWSNFGCLEGDTEGPLVVGQMVISYSCDNQSNASVDANSLATGTLAWSLPAGWTFQSGDLSGSAGKHLYATDPSGAVEALNPQTGNMEYSLSGAVTVLAVDLSRVYATCGGPNGYVCAYNITTGAQEWQNTQPMVISTTLAAEADGVLYLDVGEALNAATGKIIKALWQVTNFNTPPTALAVGDGRIALVNDPRVLDLFGLKGS
jgi:outer membrane protein assembly factor BamB